MCPAPRKNETIMMKVPQNSQNRLHPAYAAAPVSLAAVLYCRALGCSPLHLPASPLIYAVGGPLTYTLAVRWATALMYGLCGGTVYFPSGGKMGGLLLLAGQIADERRKGLALIWP